MATINPIETLNETITEEIYKHIEEFAAAYLKHTNLPPDKVVMMIQTGYSNNRFTWSIWFEERVMINENV